MRSSSQDREKLILVAIRVPKGLRYVFEGIALCGDLLTLAVQVAKYIDLAAQDIRFDWLFDEIDRTCFISPKATLIVRASGRNENDRDMARALAAAHELGEFEAVHGRHLHIEQRERDIMLQQYFQRLVA